jgi:hypothetical protein
VIDDPDLVAVGIPLADEDVVVLALDVGRAGADDVALRVEVDRGELVAVAVDAVVGRAPDVIAVRGLLAEPRVAALL